MNKFEAGRQGTGYLKKQIFSFKVFGIGLDCYIIKYPVRSFIPTHVDLVDGKRHYRPNVVYQRAGIGGHFFKNNKVQRGRVFFFRPDKDSHAVSFILAGCRKVLSIGVAI